MTFLNLSSNRFSGEIPSSFNQLPSMSVIAGNLFSCVSPPTNDINANNYICGSSNFNLSGLVYGICLGLLFLTVALLWSKWKKLLSLYSSGWTFSKDYPVMKYYDLIVQCSIMLLPLSVVLLIFVIVLKTIDFKSLIYSTHSYQYSWIGSTSFLHDILPAAFISVIIIGSLAVATSYLFNSYSDVAPVSEEHAEASMGTRVYHSIRTIVLQILNVCVVFFLNFFYVFVVVQNYSYQDVFFVQVFVAAFKVGWSLAYIPWMISVIHDSTSHISALRHELFALIFNFLLCPMLVCMLTDVNCIYYCLAGIPNVDVSYDGYIDTCSTKVFLTTRVLRVGEFCYPQKALIVQNFISPWEYSFQCGSSILFNYAPVILYSYIIYGIIFPFIQLVFLFIPIQAVAGKIHRFIFVSFDWLMYCLDVESAEIGSANFESMVSRPLLRTESVISSNLLHIIVLLTFGIGSPAVGATVVWAVFIEWVMMYIENGKYLDNMKAIGQFDFGVLRLKLSLCYQYDGLATQCLSLTVISVLIFWNMMLFDMIADVYSPLMGLVAIIVIDAVVYGVEMIIYSKRHVISGAIMDSLMPSGQASSSDGEYSKKAQSVDFGIVLTPLHDNECCSKNIETSMT